MKYKTPLLFSSVLIGFVLSGCSTREPSTVNKPVVPQKVVNDLSSHWKKGWDFDRVLAFEKGQRPKPSTYLKASYIKKHLAKFDNDTQPDKFDSGAVRFLKWSEYKTTGLLTPKDGVGFVMTKTDYDTVMHETKGDITLISEKLGLGDYYKNTPKKDILVVHVEHPKKYNLRMPSGNEIEAFPEYWIPGGKTTGGLDEAVIDFPKMDKVQTLSINEDLLSAWKNGWDERKVLNTRKGKRPNPATYLKRTM